MPLLPKPLIPAEIPVVPTPVPQRSNRAHFAERGDRMMAWFPSGIAGVQEHTNYTEAAVAYIEQESERCQLAQAEAETQARLAEQWAGNGMFAAHYKGQWSTLAGALARPATVGHGGLFYVLETDLPNVAAAEPGNHVAWTALPGLTEIGTPVNQAPAPDATVGGGSAIVLQASAFMTVYSTATFANAQWQIHTANSFVAPMYDSGAAAGGSSYTLPSAVGALLEPATRYYWRVRYRSSRGTWSAWSRASSFITSAALGQYIPVPQATPATFGAPFQGGYYAGMVWQGIARCSEAKVIAVGALTKFVLDAAYDMYAAPLVYIGQTIEVRSRANPANHFKGVVVSANARTLTVNVTAVSGGGTFADWTVMARYRCILAPKAAGQAVLKIKTTPTAMPAGCATITDGLASTAAMVAGGDAATYPMAHWARALSIGGYTDWYIPARDELELVARNLAGSVWYGGADPRYQAAIHDYKRDGAFGDVAGDQHGVNRNAWPTSAGYATTGRPPHPDPLWHFSGAERVSGIPNGIYMSSTEHDAAQVWAMQIDMEASRNYRQAQTSKDNTYQWTRVMRRSII